MQIKVKLFAILREIAACDEVTLDLPQETSCEEALLHLEGTIPGLFSILRRCLVAVNGRYAQPDTRILADDEVAILPPVSGG